MTATGQQTGPTRRRVLALAVLAPLAPLTACSADDGPPAPPPPPDPDIALRATAVQRELGLIAAYDATLAAAAPVVAARYAPVRAEHATHLAALLDQAAAPPAPAVGTRRTRDQLVVLERAAATAHATAARTASAGLAQVFASLAAAEAAHEIALA